MIIEQKSHPELYHNELLLFFINIDFISDVLFHSKNDEYAILNIQIFI